MTDETIFLFYVCLFLPFAVYRSHQRLKKAELQQTVQIDRVKLYVTTMFTLILLGFLAQRVVWAFEMPVFQPYRLTLAHAALGLGLLVLMLGFVKWRMNRKDWQPNQGMQLMVPQNGLHFGLYLVVAMLAGFCEELAYRGVAFGLFCYHLGNPLAAALFSAFFFGIAHGIQGRKAILLTGLIGLLCQGLAWVTGTLFVVMAVHCLYDVLVVLMVWTRRAKEPITETGT